MAEPRFRVIFEKLVEAQNVGEALGPQTPSIEREELDEIAELRRLALELAEPEPRSYTVT